MTRGGQEPQERPPGYAPSLWDALLKNMETNTDFNLMSFKIVRKNIEALLSARLNSKKEEVKLPVKCQVFKFCTSVKLCKLVLKKKRRSSTRINNK